MRNYLTTLFFTLAVAALSAQSGPPSAPDSLLLDSTRTDDKIDIGYGRQARRTISTATTEVAVADFNQGLISDPLQLVQGKIAGLQVYNRGGNPNRSSLLRLRGTSLGAAPDPLIIVDGIMGAALDHIDPNDIESITLLKDASATAIYGSQAASGAILIRTKDGSQIQDGLQLDYHGQGAMAQAQRRVQVMDADEFRAAGGLDAGSATDWGQEITRTAWSQAHGLSLAGAKDNTHFRLSANYRDVEGILLNSGFNQANARLQYGTTTFNNRLSLQAQAGFTYRQSDLSFPEAFQHAITFTPTAPILTESGNEQYGGYYQNVGVFNNFNPVAMLEQNDHAQRQFGYTMGVSAEYQLTQHIQLGGRWSQQNIETDTRAYYAPTSLFRGNANSTLQKGRADYLDIDSGFSFYEIFADYENTIGKVGLDLLIGYQQQDFYAASEGSSYINLNNLDYNFLASFNPPPPGVAVLSSAYRTRPGESKTALFARAAFDWQQTWFTNLSIRRDKTDLLRRDVGNVLSYAISLGADLNQYLELEQVRYAKARVGFGRTGNLPSTLPTLEFRTILVDNGSTLPSEIIGNSEGITPERQTELNLGLELATQRFEATLDLYSRSIDDLISLRVADPIFGVEPRYGNAGQLQTLGAELSLGYDLIQTDEAQWNTGLMLSTFKSTLESYFLTAEVRGNLGAPGQNSTLTTVLREGEAIGQLWGPVYEDVSPSGEPIFADLNGDGQVIASQGNALDENADFQRLGNGRPSLELGWANQFSYGSWSLNVLIRGALGHSMVNTPRAFYEARVFTNSAYNFVNTELAIDELTTARFSSLYVERADYLKLDNLSLAKRFNFNKKRKSLTLSLTAQNLLLWTNYTGVDPEPALVDYGPATGGAQIDYSTPDYAATGIDRRYSYWPAWSMVLGVRLSL
jgi:iron complex outermembrane receptor protein